MQTELIEQSAWLWTKEPDKAQVNPVVRARSDGARAVLEAGPFTWQSDLPAHLGGENKAPSPTALLLGALSGCAVLFIRDTIAPQLGVRVDSVHAEARCKADFRGRLGMPGALPDLQDLEITIRIQSPDSDEKVQKVYLAWLQRSPIYLALARPLRVKAKLVRAAVVPPAAFGG